MSFYFILFNLFKKKPSFHNDSLIIVEELSK